MIDLHDYLACLSYEKNRQLVGVRFIYGENDYATSTFPEATHQLFFCMMVKIAASGKAMKVTAKHLYCSAAAEVLGFASPSSEILSGSVSHRREFCCSQDIGFQIQQDFPYLDHQPLGMEIAPLTQFTTEPDVVISFSTPYTAMRIMQAYTYLYGYAQNIQMGGMSGVCAELMAQAYKCQDLSVSLLCSGTRFCGSWFDNELGVAMPFSMFKEVKDSVVQTFNTFEPDDKKEAIAHRAEATTPLSVPIAFDSNYYESCLGVAKMGVEGYPKKLTKYTR